MGFCHEIWGFPVIVSLQYQSIDSGFQTRTRLLLSPWNMIKHGQFKAIGPLDAGAATRFGARLAASFIPYMCWIFKNQPKNAGYPGSPMHNIDQNE
jgi:hypothetical protein